MKNKLIIILIVLLFTKITVLGQSIKDYYIPDTTFNKATYYAPDESGNRTGFIRTIYYIKKGLNYDIVDARFFNNQPLAIETTTVWFIGKEVRMIKSVTTNPLETNKKRIYNPAKIILKMPLPGQPTTWILIQASGQKDVKTSSLITLEIDGVQKKAIKVKTVVSGHGLAYTNEYYVVGFGLWKSETVGNGSKNTLFQFDELSNENTK